MQMMQSNYQKLM